MVEKGPEDPTVEDSHWYEKTPLPPVGLLAIMVAAGLAEQAVVEGAVTVLPETGCVIVTATTLEKFTQASAFTRRRYQRLAASVAAKGKSCAVAPPMAEKPLLALVDEIFHA